MNGIYAIIAIGLAVSVFTLYAPNIVKWCDKQLAKKH